MKKIKNYQKTNIYKNIKNIEKSFIAGIVLSSKEVFLIKKKNIDLNNSKVILILENKLIIKGLFNKFSTNYILLNKKEILYIKKFLTKNNRENIKIIFIDRIFWINNKIKLYLHCGLKKRKKIKISNNKYNKYIDEY